MRCSRDWFPTSCTVGHPCMVSPLLAQEWGHHQVPPCRAPSWGPLPTHLQCKRVVQKGCLPTTLCKATRDIFRASFGPDLAPGAFIADVALFGSD